MDSYRYGQILANQQHGNYYHGSDGNYLPIPTIQSDKARIRPPFEPFVFISEEALGKKEGLRKGKWTVSNLLLLSLANYLK